MTLKEALKNNKVVETSLDNYKLADGRTVKYDRYVKGNYNWVCSDGYAYRNFCECYNRNTAFAREIA